MSSGEILKFSWRKNVQFLLGLCSFKLGAVCFWKRGVKKDAGLLCATWSWVWPVLNKSVSFNGLAKP